MMPCCVLPWTIDDVAARIEERRRRNGQSLKQVVNALLREGLRSGQRTPAARNGRGGGVPAILARSERHSGRQPVYEMFGNELRLTIYAAGPAAEGAAR